MTWKTIRLALARTPEYPEGSDEHLYVLRLPLSHNDLIDADALRRDAENATVARIWKDQETKHGSIIRKGRNWAFSYELGDADDEGIFHLENHSLSIGSYLSITETDGVQLPFKVISLS